MKKYIFYLRLLIDLTVRLDFSVTSVKKFCSRTIEKNSTDYHARFLLAEMYRSENKNVDAIEQYNSLIKDGFENSKVIYGLAVASFKEEFYDESRKYFKKLLEINFNTKIALDHLGRINLINDNFREAIMYLQQSLKLEPRNPLILENVAYCYYSTGEYKKSYEAYQKAFELNPNAELQKHMDLAKSSLELQNNDIV